MEIRYMSKIHTQVIQSLILIQQFNCKVDVFLRNHSEKNIQ